MQLLHNVHCILQLFTLFETRRGFIKMCDLSGIILIMQ